jgi:hypothetical protein
LGKVRAYDVLDMFFDIDKGISIWSVQSLEVVNHDSDLRKQRDSIDMQKHIGYDLCVVRLRDLGVHFYVVRLGMLDTERRMRRAYLMRTRKQRSVVEMSCQG